MLEWGHLMEMELPRAVDWEKSVVTPCESPEMEQKEVWAHLLAYNLLRGPMA